jgi:hypothetical protein
MKPLGLAALFAAGVLGAGVLATVGGAQTTETTTETVHETTTQTVTQPTTVHETTTVQQTTTAPATTVTSTETQTVVTTTTPPVTTSGEATSTTGTPTWVWVLLALLGAAVIGLAVVLFSRRGAGIPDMERRQRLQGAVAGWTAQGWALLNQTADTALLQRGDERMAVSVDQAGQISTRLVTAQPPARPGVDPNAPTERFGPNDPYGPSGPGSA